MLAAQVCHAAGESVAPDDPPPPGTHAVVLAARPAQLIAVHTRLQHAGVPHATITENDDPYAGEIMAIGIQPAARSEVYPYVKRFSLLV